MRQPKKPGAAKRGRPPLSTPTVRWVIRVPKDVRNSVRLRAEVEGRTMSRVVVMALEAHLGKKRRSPKV